MGRRVSDTYFEGDNKEGVFSPSKENPVSTISNHIISKSCYTTIRMKNNYFETAMQTIYRLRPICAFIS